MISVRLDYNGKYDVRWPRTDMQILELGRAYLEQEALQAAEVHVLMPSTARIQALYDAAVIGATTGESGEVERAAAAQSYEQQLREAIDLLRQAILSLKAKYRKQLAQLEAWGLKTRQNGTSIIVNSPRSDADWRAFLLKYVAQEESLEASQRIMDPPLESLQPLAKRLPEELNKRDESTTQRRSGIYQRSESAAELLDVLQVAVLVLVSERFGGKVQPELEDWGLTVVEHAPATTATAEPISNEKAASTTQSAQASVSAGAAP